MIDSYFKDKGLVRQQLDSFNDFIEYGIQSAIVQTQAIEVEAKPQFSSNEFVEPVRHCSCCSLFFRLFLDGLTPTFLLFS